MRTCKEMEPLILNYVSGDILNSQKNILDEHLANCDACVNEIMKFQRLDLNLMELKEEEVEPPEELKIAILKEINTGSKKGKGGAKRFLSPTVILSTVTTCLAVLVFLLAAKVDKISNYTNEPKSQTVKIMFFSNDAKNVSLVGDFNGWGAEPLLFKNSKGGMWVADVKLKPGMYQYNLVVDGDKWVANPNSKSQVPDGFGGVNSVVIVNGNGENQIEKLGTEI